MTKTLGEIAVVLNARIGPLEKQVQKVDATLGRLETRAKSFGKTMTSAGKKMRNSLTLPILGAAGVATYQFTQFEKGMRNVNTIARETEAQFDRTSDAVLDMAVELGKSPMGMADALYNINSASFKSAAGLEVLEAATKAGVAGLADTATSAKATTAILNAYGKSSKEATDVSDVLFKTVERGVLAYGELASFLGSTAGTAAALKVDFAEVAAAVATMTRGGINAAETFTALNRLMMRFLNASPELKTAMKAAGFESADAMFKTLGLAKSIRWLNELTGGSAQKLSDLGFLENDLKAALKLTGDQADDYAEDLQQIAIKANRAGAAQNAFNEQTKTVSHTLDQLKATLQAGAIKFVGEFSGELKSLVEDLRDAAKWFLNLSRPTKVWTVRILAGTAAIGPLLMLVGNLSTSLYFMSKVTRSVATHMLGLTKAAVAAIPKLSAYFATINTGAMSNQTIMQRALAGDMIRTFSKKQLMIGRAAGIAGAFAGGWFVGRFLNKITGGAIDEGMKKFWTKLGIGMAKGPDQAYVDEMVSKAVTARAQRKAAGLATGATVKSDLEKEMEEIQKIIDDNLPTVPDFDEIMGKAQPERDFAARLNDMLVRRLPLEEQLLRLTAERKDLTEKIAKASGEEALALKNAALDTEEQLLGIIDRLKAKRRDVLEETQSQAMKSNLAAAVLKGSAEAYRIEVGGKRDDKLKEVSDNTKKQVEKMDKMIENGKSVIDLLQEVLLFQEPEVEIVG